MTVPNLNRRLVLESLVSAPDGAGGFAQSWVPLGSHWAEIQARTGQERTQSTGPVSVLKVQIVIRNAPYGSLSRPKAEQRFREGDRVYAISAVADHDDAGHYLRCIAEEERAT